MIEVMRDFKSMRKLEHGFGRMEMAFLILLTAVFLVGVVFLVDRGVSSLGSQGGSAALQDKGQRLIGKLESLLQDARAFVAEERAPLWDLEEKSENGGSRRAVVFLADLDGDGKTGGFRAEGATGLEQVELFRTAPDTPRLLVDVVESPGGQPKEVSLTGFLDTGNPRAFNVEYVLTGDTRQTTPVSVSVDRVKISVVLAEGGRARRFEKTINLGFAPVGFTSAP